MTIDNQKLISDFGRLDKVMLQMFEIVILKIIANFSFSANTMLWKLEQT